MRRRRPRPSSRPSAPPPARPAASSLSKTTPVPAHAHRAPSPSSLPSTRKHQIRTVASRIATRRESGGRRQREEGSERAREWLCVGGGVSLLATVGALCRLSGTVLQGVKCSICHRHHSWCCSCCGGCFGGGCCSCSCCGGCCCDRYRCMAL